MRSSERWMQELKGSQPLVFQALEEFRKVGCVVWTVPGEAHTVMADPLYKTWDIERGPHPLAAMNVAPRSYRAVWDALVAAGMEPGWRGGHWVWVEGGLATIGNMFGRRDHLYDAADMVKAKTFSDPWTLAQIVLFMADEVLGIHSVDLLVKERNALSQWVAEYMAGAAVPEMPQSPVTAETKDLRVSLVENAFSVCRCLREAQFTHAQAKANTVSAIKQAAEIQGAHLTDRYFTHVDYSKYRWNECARLYRMIFSDMLRAQFPAVWPVKRN